MLFVQLTISVQIAIFCWDAHVKKYGKELATRDRLFTQTVSQGHNARKRETYIHFLMVDTPYFYPQFILLYFILIVSHNSFY